YGGARGHHRLCRGPGHRADHPQKAAPGLSEGRVPLRARLCGFDCPPHPAEGSHCQAVEAPQKGGGTMSAYEKVLLARAKDRPTGLSYIENIFEDFIELHGDRRFADDPAIVGGIATLHGRPVTVIAMEKGKDMRERVRRNFGAPNPEGYRKALRLMEQAEKFRRPVVCFVDTSGAFCGMGAEERGQGQAIAENLVTMA